MPFSSPPLPPSFLFLPPSFRPAPPYSSLLVTSVTDVTIDVGDDAVSVKAGLHWKTKKKVPAQNYLFERVTILHRNFAIGSDVSGDVINIT